MVDIPRYIAAFSCSPLARWCDLAPWELTGQSAAFVRVLLAELSPTEYEISDEIAVHRSATVEAGAEEILADDGES
jgi:hypothetical protein